MSRWNLVVDEKSQRKFDAHLKKWVGCTACSLHAGKRVAYRGYIPSTILFWGEAPGESETVIPVDKEIKFPFVGPAGDVIDGIIKEAIPNVTYLLGNTVLCTPPRVNGKIRIPTTKEKEECFIRFREIKDICQATYVVALGAEAKSTLGDDSDLNLVHPSYILRLSDKPMKQKIEIQSAILKLRELVNG